MVKLSPHEQAMEPDILKHTKSKKLVQSGNSGEYPNGEFGPKPKAPHSDLMGAGKKKVNRLKKATRWRDFSKDTVSDGIDLADKALTVKDKHDPVSQAQKSVTKAFGGAKPKKAKAEAETKVEAKAEIKVETKAKRPPSKWILHVKAYREKHGGSYKDAMKAAKATYKK